MIELQSGVVTHLDAAGQLQMMTIEPGMALLSTQEVHELAQLIDSIHQLHVSTPAAAPAVDVPKLAPIGEVTEVVDESESEPEPVRPAPASLAAALAVPVTPWKDRKITARPQHGKPASGLHTGAMDRIAAVLTDVAQTVVQLSDASGVPASSLSTMMHRLIANGRAVKVSRGLYRRGEA
jgi:hypothetical protein